MSARPGLLRRNPDFARLYTATLVSFAGDWFAWVALQGLVLSTTKRPVLAAAMMASSTLPYAIVSPFAGVIADRVDRRKLMIASDLARAFVALGLLFVTDGSMIWLAFVLNATLSAIAPFFEPASSASLPNLVRREDLAQANVLMGSAWGTMLAVGAALGGLVSATLGREAAFIVNAASFGGSGVLVWTIRASFREKPREPHHVTVLEDIRIAVRFARRESRVFAVLMMKGLSGIGGGTIALISVMATFAFASGDTGIGILMGARGVGALAGPFLFRRFVLRGRDERIIRTLAVGASLFAVGYLIFGQSPNLWAASIALAVAHVGGGANWAMSAYALQRYTPDEVRGRIFSFDYALITLTMSAAMLVAGFLAGRFGAREVTTVWSLATFGAFLLWYLWAERLIHRAPATQPG